MTYRRLAIGVTLLLVFAPACKSKGDHALGLPEAKAESPKPAPILRPAPTPPPPLEPLSPIELKISSVGDQMKFDVTRFTVRAGARVHVSFHSNATLGVLPHNWVLVKPGTEAAVALAGLGKGPEGGYVAQGPDVLAFTSLAQPGQTVETTFVAPEPGTYSYICTVPGHYIFMRGKLIVTAS